MELNAGKAAVAVMAHSDTAPAISDQLTQLGGTSESHELTDEALQTAECGYLGSLIDKAAWTPRHESPTPRQLDGLPVPPRAAAGALPLSPDSGGASARESAAPIHAKQEQGAVGSTDDHREEPRPATTALRPIAVVRRSRIRVLVSLDNPQPGR